MIQKLTIKDFAIIDELELNFSDGLTVITGDTGSGKSVLVRALSIALGKKPQKSDVRSQSPRAVVEAEIHSTAYRRIIHSTGRVKSYIDEEPKQANEFSTAVKSIVDFHGQHGQQSLMDGKTHLDYLDRFSGGSDLVEAVSKIFVDLQEAQEDYQRLKLLQKQADERKELLEFQFREISTVDPQPDEDLVLGREYKILNHMEDFIDTAQRLNQTFTEEDHSVYQQLAHAIQDLERLTKVDPAMKPFMEILESASLGIQDVSSGLIDHVNSMDHDKNRIRGLEDRIQSIEVLKRKYGGSLPAVLETFERIQREMTELADIGGAVKEKEQDIQDLVSQYQDLADKLHSLRVKSEPLLARAIEAEMKALDFPAASFSVELNIQEKEDSRVIYKGKGVKATLWGYDEAQFFLSANPGEELKPLTKIASGGEVSRIMLAIKSVFQRSDPVIAMVFDEIDTGISGVAAEKVGESLAKLAKDKQIICITHLPQIASRADHHIHVTKSTDGSRTRVAAEYLDSHERVKVVAQLFSGSLISSESLGSAKSSLEAPRG